MAIISGVTISGGGVTILGGGAPATDPYFMYNSLLLPGNGTNTAQNNTFLDGSTNNFTITRNGNTTQGTFSPYGPNWSNYLAGAGNYFQTPASSASTIVGTLSNTANLTIECWIYPTAYNSSANFPGLIGDMIATFENNNWSWGITNTGTLMIYWNVSGTQLRATSTNAVSLNTWTHIALNVAAGAITMYINGVSQSLSGTTTLSTPSTSNGYLVIGQWNNGSGGTGGTSHGLYTGYISNLRIVKASTYTSSFTPSTTPLTAIANTSLLYCQSNRFKDNSTNNLAITLGGSPTIQRFSPFSPTQAYDTSTIGGSGYIATAATSYLSFTDSSNNLDLGGAVASFETWIYPTAATCIIAVKSGGTANYNTSTGVEWSMPLAAQQFIFYYNNGGSYSALTDPTTGRPLNQWYHYAVATNATTISLFINGVRVATATANVSKPTDRTLVRVGEDLGGNGGICYLSDTRFIRGAGAYDPTASTITIPSAPLTAVANTQLLLNYTNVGIIDNAMMNNLETVGNAQISTTQSKFGGSSMYFDGTGDYLICPSTPQLILAGSFTVELWLYFNAIPSNYINIFQGIGASTQFFITTKSNGQGLRFGLSGVAEYAAGTQTWTTGTWYHVALVRNGTDVKFYVNGTNVSDSTYTNSTTYSGVLGIGGTFAGQADLNGYIDDLRITKGYARYTSNFTPPTTAFPLN